MLNDGILCLLLKLPECIACSLSNNGNQAIHLSGFLFEFQSFLVNDMLGMFYLEWRWRYFDRYCAMHSGSCGNKHWMASLSMWSIGKWSILISKIISVSLLTGYVLLRIVLCLSRDLYFSLLIMLAITIFKVFDLSYFEIVF